MGFFLSYPKSKLQVSLYMIVLSLSLRNPTFQIYVHLVVLPLSTTPLLTKHKPNAFRAYLFVSTQMIKRTNALTITSMWILDICHMSLETYPTSFENLRIYHNGGFALFFINIRWLFRTHMLVGNLTQNNDYIQRCQFHLCWAVV